MGKLVHDRMPVCRVVFHSTGNYALDYSRSVVRVVPRSVMLHSIGNAFAKHCTHSVAHGELD